jgi:hypothetical protein
MFDRDTEILKFLGGTLAIIPYYNCDLRLLSSSLLSIINIIIVFVKFFL